MKKWFSNLNFKLSFFRNETSKREGKCVAPFADYEKIETDLKSRSKTKAQNKKGIHSHHLLILKQWKFKN